MHAFGHLYLLVSLTYLDTISSADPPTQCKKDQLGQLPYTFTWDLTIQDRITQDFTFRDHTAGGYVGMTITRNMSRCFGPGIFDVIVVRINSRINFVSQ
ncbi:hypothetical protein P153DRAFT_202322 [Dothidotthia symphoricarpi CBS 119687]|uniref:Uncharacterized protein n=1 Tax=Dothidotthia symphoricarpi CBS 119687 TaxID=1392245 RepID=A0A6A6AKJ7_9PLEO|nr:uncharacterized protein P153DRAFT_202322 [Dothidotthia symphoricarpi CBS 119687]KAF2131753.1 hypothetical protein P153DRAFT_202322 [Dothidotthia symphoricarpi CBS 119687]